MYKNLDLGFNIDLLGIIYGGSQRGSFRNREAYIQGKYSGSEEVAVSGTPTFFNLLLISDNDLGSLNSELYAQYRFGSRWSAKLAFAFMFAEYTLDQRPRYNNDRYRYKAGQLDLGVGYIFGK